MKSRVFLASNKPMGTTYFVSGHNNQSATRSNKLMVLNQSIGNSRLSVCGSFTWGAMSILSGVFSGDLCLPEERLSRPFWKGPGFRSTSLHCSDHNSKVTLLLIITQIIKFFLGRKAKIKKK
jgi:hypothetical protein